ncbi:Imm70 family immunity protein [Scopulibacillus daqui]
MLPNKSWRFLYSFFSTISYHLEPNGWGDSYSKPLTLND